MRKRLLLAICIFGLTACATMNVDGGLLYRHNQETRLEEAIKLQDQGKISSASEMLKAIVADKGLSGVTDEALFRLSMIYLGYGLDNDKEFVAFAQQSIERLQKEYPASSWAAMAAPVSDLLSTAAELRRQVQAGKSQAQSQAKENQSLAKENQSLSKENQELKDSIEKLKRLDLELDKKRK